MAEINSKWTSRFLKLATEVSTWSKDPSTCVGAVVTDGKRVLSVGFNGAPEGLDDEWVLRDRPTKIACTIHAEQNALEYSERLNLGGCTIYVTHPPCDRCAALIIKKRISEVVYYDPDQHMRERWNCDFSDEMLRKAGIKVTRIEKSLTTDQ